MASHNQATEEQRNALLKIVSGDSPLLRTGTEFDISAKSGVHKCFGKINATGKWAQVQEELALLMNLSVIQVKVPFLGRFVRRKLTAK